MNSEQQAFIRAICAAPEDDAFRLIYADWLDEHGESERAEFIRVQIELAKPKYNTLAGRRRMRKGKRLREREREFRDNHSGPLWSRLPISGDPIVVLLPGETPIPAIAHNPQVILRRGFIESITCTAADCLAHLDAIREQHPIREMRLTTMPGIRVARRGPTTGKMVYRGRLVGRKWRDLPCAENLPDPETTMSLLVAEWPGITFHLPQQTGLGHSYSLPQAITGLHISPEGAY